MTYENGSHRTKVTLSRCADGVLFGVVSERELVLTDSFMVVLM